jgi:tetratricopeptide (TPR) repeat protein
MHKCIFQGKLNFKKSSSFEKALEQYVHRAEVFFKNEMVFKGEDVFDEDELALVINRTVVNITEKVWKNTIDLFYYIRQFAMSGQVECWMVESGQILEYHSYEPKGDKSVIINYREGKRLSDEEGKEEEAIAILTKAIDKYERHSQAYERRGYTNLKLKSYQDARYDFDKSIRLDQLNAKAFYGRGRLNMIEEKWDEAVADFDSASKKSLAVEPLFWMAKRKKAEALIEAKRYDEAIKELQLLLKKKFRDGDPNLDYIPQIHTLYVKALINTGEEHEALDFIESNLSDLPPQQGVNRRSLITDRGVVRKLLGQKDFRKDWEEAAKLGEPRANQLLEESN